MTSDLKPDYVDQQNEILENITKQEIDALAAKHLKLEDMITIVVGDKAKVMDEVKALGHPIIELDADGKVVE